MTKREFLDSIPDIIYHETHGYGELTIIVDKPDHKGVYYQHKDKSASYGTYGKDWQLVYDDLGPFLKEKGLM